MHFINFHIFHACILQTGFPLGYAKGFSYSSCGGKDDLVTFKSITLQPDTLNFPGNVTIGVTGTISADVTAPISVSVKGQFYRLTCWTLFSFWVSRILTRLSFEFYQLEFRLYKKYFKKRWFPVPCYYFDSGCKIDDVCPMLAEGCPGDQPCRCPFKSVGILSWTLSKSYIFIVYAHY